MLTREFPTDVCFRAPCWSRWFVPVGASLPVVFGIHGVHSALENSDGSFPDPKAFAWAFAIWTVCFAVAGFLGTLVVWRARLEVCGNTIRKTSVFGSETIQTGFVQRVEWLHRNKKARLEAGSQSLTILFDTYEPGLREHLRELLPEGVHDGWLTDEQRRRKPPPPWACYLYCLLSCFFAALGVVVSQMNPFAGALQVVLVFPLALGSLAVARRPNERPFRWNSARRTEQSD